MGAVLPAPVDYTDLDHSSLSARLVRLCKSAFPDLDVDDVAELARAMLDANAFIGDVLAFYLRKTGREARWTTATQRRSLLALTKLIGYRPAGATAATAVETFTVQAPVVGDVVVPAGRFVKTKEVPTPVKFQLLEDLMIPAGQTSALAPVENSAPAFDVFSSGGHASQRMTLTKTPFLDGSAVPIAANGTFTEVRNFFDSGPADRHFTSRVDQNDRATVVFGDGISGAIPVGTVNIAYKVGGGTSGRVAAGALSTLEGSYTDSFGTPVRITVNNLAKAEGGADRESVQQTRSLAPASLRVLERAVAREDFEVGALKVPGVTRALALGLDEDPAVGENTMNVFIVPDGGGAPSQALLDRTRAQFVPVSGFPKPPLKATNSLRLNVFGALYLLLNVQTVVFLRRGAAPGAVRAAILTRLAAFLSPTLTVGALLGLAPELAQTIAQGLPASAIVQNPLVDFGYYIQNEDGDPTGAFAFSDIYNVVRDTPGVLKIGDGSGLLLNGLPNDVVILPKQFPTLGTVAILNGATGLPL